MVEVAEHLSPGVVEIVPGRSPAGDCQFSVLVKRSYRIVPGQRAQRLDKDAPLRMVDAYYDGGDPTWSVVEHESEMAPFKAATDIVVIGQAHAPSGRAVQAMVVGVRVGSQQKVLRVTGDRVCHWRDGADPVFSDPLPFRHMPIRYDRAYGGRDEKSDAQLPFFYPRNDMGRGVALRNVRESVQDLPLPNIEGPDELLTPERVIIGDPRRWPRQPLPQGLGWRQRTWYPRSALLGAMPAFVDAGTVTPEERMKLLPAGHIALARQMRLPPFEAKFHNGASLGLVLAAVDADVPIALRGLNETGALDFQLPGETPQIRLDTGAGEVELTARMLTVSIRPDDLALDIVWGGLRPFGPYAQLAKLRTLRAHVS